MHVLSGKIFQLSWNNNFKLRSCLGYGVLYQAVCFFAELKNLTLTGKGSNNIEDGSVVIETGAKVSFNASLSKAYQPNVAYRWGLWKASQNIIIVFLSEGFEFYTFSKDTTFDKRLVYNFFILLGVLHKTSSCNFCGFHLECKRDESKCDKTWVMMM